MKKTFLRNQIIISLIISVLCYGIYIFVLGEEPSTIENRLKFILITAVVNTGSVIFHLLSVL